MTGGLVKGTKDMSVAFKFSYLIKDISVAKIELLTCSFSSINEYYNYYNILYFYILKNFSNCISCKYLRQNT